MSISNKFMFHANVAKRKVESIRSNGTFTDRSGGQRSSTITADKSRPLTRNRVTLSEKNHGSTRSVLTARRADGRPSVVN